MKRKTLQSQEAHEFGTVKKRKSTDKHTIYIP